MMFIWSRALAGVMYATCGTNDTFYGKFKFGTYFRSSTIFCVSQLHARTNRQPNLRGAN